MLGFVVDYFGHFGGLFEYLLGCFFFFFFFGLSFAMTTVVEGCVLYGELH